MNAYALALMFAAILLGGCRATRDVAVTSYHVTRGVAVGSYRVATAPVHYALRKRGEGSEAVTMETTSSGEAKPMPASDVAVTQPQSQPAAERSSNRSAVVSRANRKEAAQARQNRRHRHVPLQHKLNFQPPRRFLANPDTLLAPSIRVEDTSI